MRWEWHVACMGDVKMHTLFGLENVKGNDHLRDLDTSKNYIKIDIKGRGYEDGMD
jgi:hypothetical protein